MNVDRSTTTTTKRSLLKSKVGDIFAGRGNKRYSHGAPDPQDNSESSLSSGELSLTFHLNNHNTSVTRGSEELNNRLSLSSSDHSRLSKSNPRNSNGHDSLTGILLANTKRRSTPLADTKVPPKPKKVRSFKMDGVPAFMSEQIEKNVQRDEEQRRKRQQQKAATTMSNLHDSIGSLSLHHQPMQQRKQRPKVRFLSLPKDHPLHWDSAKLSAADFPEEDRAFLAKALKNPTTTKTTVRGQPLPMQVQVTLQKMHLKDWDAPTIVRSAMTLFHPDSNPLGLSPVVSNYFFTRFNTLKTSLEEGVQVDFMDTLYPQEKPLSELYMRLRKEFEDATRVYDVYQHNAF